MNTHTHCLEVRRILGAEPQCRDQLVLEHCKTCAACAAFLKEMLLLDVRLQRALTVDVPDELEARIVFRTAFRPAQRRTYIWFAAAAAVVLAVSVGLGVWQYRQNSPAMLGAALVAHVMDPQESTGTGSGTSRHPGCEFRDRGVDPRGC